MKILINDGIEAIGRQLLEEAGFTVDTQKIEQAELINRLNEYDAICVRSATKVRKELIDASPNLKAIGRGGVGLDNIDVEYARSKGIAVINTPNASTRSVGELVIAHMLNLSRNLYKSNREMPLYGDTKFNDLKKAYAQGVELEGKTLGIIGFGHIGQETASCALGMGMNVLAVDPYNSKATINIGPAALEFKVDIHTIPLDDMLESADYISLHTPSLDKPVLGNEEFSKMKDGVIIINCSRGGTLDEGALLDALNSGKVAAAGLDVFMNEPSPNKVLLTHPHVSLSPHIGGSTTEAQNKIGEELAIKLIATLKGQ
ncbi:MAG: phosphoglycerate dehydrogenase [Bacteroidetes bacterium OLB9]|nr:MAG: phosphoglycerate dehydrogenase [Bacteroidetes bacterium OLB9]MCZ2339115.1 D-2-hydroxyacid dehydrogenase [Chitinophagales bacterium]